MRIHPAIIAQAAATTACLLPGRFFLGVGGGQRQRRAGGGAVVCGPNPENHLDGIRRYVEAGYDHVYFHQVGPDQDGLDVLAALRSRRDVPVIFVTAKDGGSDRVRGLESGADDYIVKPFSAEELSARIRAVLRRWASRAKVARVVTAGRLTVDLVANTSTLDGKTLDLTRTEWSVLQHLAANAGRVVLNSELLTKVWGPEYRDELQYLRVWISRLRRKIEDNPAQPSVIKTLHGIGYIMEPSLDGETVAPSRA